MSLIPTKHLGRGFSCCCLHQHREVPPASRKFTTTAERIQNHILGKSSSSMRPSKRATTVLADGLDLGSRRHISWMICVKVREAGRGTRFSGAMSEYRTEAFVQVKKYSTHTERQSLRTTTVTKRSSVKQSTIIVGRTSEIRQA